MSSIQELVKLGRELGYDGDELKSFVSDEQARLRDERELERRNRKEKEEREREEREREREREEREREREDREREREHALALERLKLQVAGGSAALGVPSVDFAARPKLPSYREGEDIASYFTRFERVATLLNIAKSSYAVHLGSLLTGKLAEFYTTLSEEVTGDYSQLKEAILKHSHRTSDHYRTAFRSAKINVGDTFQQFSTHLTRLFDHWLSASEVDHSLLR
ncbi:drebrin-like [Eriocheir sinensis]|uniref:drebrin-like n=1 Tax=Eriocheir sinensis TaxID=95602 RepID=UPI0021C632EA|nr:drebrin-like [Eriocheir sinensis]